MISVTILTKNSERHLSEVLSSLSAFPEIVIFDTGSQDSTLSIAKNFPNTSIYERSFQGFGPAHNEASSLAKYDWIFSLDSDELLSCELKKEILSLGNMPDNYVYSMWRKNIFRNRHITGCGWYPDRVARLYNKKNTKFSDDLVHEKVLTSTSIVQNLHNPLIHYPMKGCSSFLAKTEHYSTLYAQEHSKAKASIMKALSHGLFAFCKSYFLQKGWRLGAEGLEISWYNMNCAFYKYAKIREYSCTKANTEEH
jgi:glycosyltransferase involved in cell wall biosynthesis